MGNKHTNFKVKSVGVMLLVFIACFLLSGCLYGNRIKQSGLQPTGHYVELVENAVKLYREKTGVLPIRNKEESVPLLERYLVDFSLLAGAGILATPPANAFENGGTAIYVFVRTETEPEVKLIDLVLHQQLAAIQRAVNEYASKRKGALPLGEQVYPRMWKLDDEALNRKPEPVQSPYSEMKLNVLVTDTGQIVLDYAPEIMRIIDRDKLDPAGLPGDLRELLLDESHFVPVFSVPYRWEEDRPVPDLV